MITAGDDFPIHQTPEPVQQVFTSDRNFYDRFFFNGYWREGAPFFALAMGIYPNVGIFDAAFSVVADGVQHCVRASRLLGDRMDTRAGPIAIEIVHPMRTLRIRVEHEAVRADLTFEGRAAAIEEPRFSRRAGARLVMDLTRFTQHGGYSGVLTAGGRTYHADPTRVWGSRDRSWGVRGIGPRDPAGAPASEASQFFWLWSPTNFEDVCTHFDVNENADGSRWHEFGAMTDADRAASPRRARSVAWEIDYKPGTRHARRAGITLILSDEDRHHIDLEMLYNFYMQGIGYGHPKWGHGMFVDTDASTYESFRTAEVDETQIGNQHIQAVCKARLGSREGVGILEMIALGPHKPSGFKEQLDMRP